MDQYLGQAAVETGLQTGPGSRNAAAPGPEWRMDGEMLAIVRTFVQIIAARDRAPLASGFRLLAKPTRFKF